ncbi:hypothetical protein [Komagataeibacter medellinensis]|uniref:hypothetical protein n=1 Tax=Komagataeibacter medellinensis TaxID=1177712 RepID=UPI001294BB9A|nr:hypothetical protein [Komagataeibacter medellinensis]
MLAGVRGVVAGWIAAHLLPPLCTSIGGVVVLVHSSAVENGFCAVDLFSSCRV